MNNFPPLELEVRGILGSSRQRGACVWPRGRVPSLAVSVQRRYIPPQGNMGGKDTGPHS